MPKSDRLLTGADSELVLSESDFLRDVGYAGYAAWPTVPPRKTCARQQDRVRFFEVGKSFHGSLGDVTRGTVANCRPYPWKSVVPEQWGQSAQAADFFDIKSRRRKPLRTHRRCERLSLLSLPTIHHVQPGQAATLILRGEDAVGMRRVNCIPSVSKFFGIKKRAAYLFSS